MRTSRLLAAVCTLIAGCASGPTLVPTSDVRPATELMRGAPIVISPVSVRSDVVSIPIDWQYTLVPDARTLPSLTQHGVNGTSYFSASGVLSTARKDTLYDDRPGQFSCIFSSAPAVGTAYVDRARAGECTP